MNCTADNSVRLVQQWLEINSVITQRSIDYKLLTFVWQATPKKQTSTQGKENSNEQQTKLRAETKAKQLTSYKNKVCSLESFTYQVTWSYKRVANKVTHTKKRWRFVTTKRHLSDLKVQNVGHQSDDWHSQWYIEWNEGKLWSRWKLVTSEARLWFTNKIKQNLMVFTQQQNTKTKQ